MPSSLTPVCTGPAPRAENLLPLTNNSCSPRLQSTSCKTVSTQSTLDLSSRIEDRSSFTNRVLFNDLEEHISETRSFGNVNTPVPMRFNSTKSQRTYTYRTRERAKPRELSQLRKRRLRNANCSENPFERIRDCCKQYKCFYNADKIYAFRWYRDVMEMDREHSKATLISWYSPVRKQFEFNGRPVCWRFLNGAFGFSNDLLSAVRGTAHAKAAQTSFAQPRQIRRRTLRDSIITFLKLIADACGDRMPNRNFTNLPFPTRGQVYERYLVHYNNYDHLRFTKSPPVLKTFYAVWSNHVPDVIVRKYTGFERCQECLYYDEEGARNILNPPVLRYLKDAANPHYAEMTSERRGYEMRQQLAGIDPQNYLSLVVDGADQSNYGLPHFLEKSKQDKGHKIAVKIVGVLMHGVENKLFLFPMVEGFETRASHVIECIHRSIDTDKLNIGKLRRVLLVQADNCTRENKNRYFLSYRQILVALGVFVEVQMSSLEIGHTHTDIDQAFSCVHRRIDQTAALSLRQLEKELKHCYNPSPVVEELNRVANVSLMFEQSNSLTKRSNFTRYRYFRFLCMSNEAAEGLYSTKCLVEMKYSDEWCELPGVNGFLKNVPNLLNVPKTKTKAPSNVREVSLCLKAADGRIRCDETMQELYALRDRVYVSREYEGHWCQESFEFNGDYRAAASQVELSSIAQAVNFGNTVMNQNAQRYRYDLGDFVAVKPAAEYNTPFWVAEVYGFR